MAHYPAAPYPLLFPPVIGGLSLPPLHGLHGPPPPSGCSTPSPAKMLIKDVISTPEETGHLINDMSNELGHDAIKITDDNPDFNIDLGVFKPYPQNSAGLPITVTSEPVRLSRRVILITSPYFKFQSLGEYWPQRSYHHHNRLFSILSIPLLALAVSLQDL
ncbi:hypothetical protein MJT46_018773 [Ovis ammon polii x Ovis aries]|nr:hypothetical protein MJT46_018773 [Ovis ammon polii x Ovis aries]